MFLPFFTVYGRRGGLLLFENAGLVPGGRLWSKGLLLLLGRLWLRLTRSGASSVILTGVVSGSLVNSFKAADKRVTESVSVNNSSALPR